MLTVLVSIASLCWVKGAALLACAPFGSGCLLLGMLVLSGVDVLAALVAAGPSPTATTSYSCIKSLLYPRNKSR